MNTTIQTPEEKAASKKTLQQMVFCLATIWAVLFLSLFTLCQSVGVPQAIAALSAPPILAWTPFVVFAFTAGASLVMAKLWRNPLILLFTPLTGIVISSSFFPFEHAGVATNQVLHLLKMIG